MIVLDTNVVSEALRPTPSSQVVNWLDRQDPQSTFITSVTLAELLFGVAVMPEGRRKAALIEAVDGVAQLFAGRTLAFDAMAAQHYAALAVSARQAGLGFPTPDGYIAAIASAQNCSVATRDKAAFLAAGLTVIDPWHET
jgi:predicted nucleic acid-binding protein